MTFKGNFREETYAWIEHALRTHSYFTRTAKDARLVGGDEFAQFQLGLMSSWNCNRVGIETSLVYTFSMAVKRMSHAIYDTKYHLVWALKVS